MFMSLMGGMVLALVVSVSTGYKTCEYMCVYPNGALSTDKLFIHIQSNLWTRSASTQSIVCFFFLSRDMLSIYTTSQSLTVLLHNLWFKFVVNILPIIIIHKHTLQRLVIYCWMTHKTTDSGFYQTLHFSYICWSLRHTDNLSHTSQGNSCLRHRCYTNIVAPVADGIEKS